MTDQVWQKNLSKRSTWLRGLYMLLFWLIYNVAEIVMIAVALFQFVVTLFTGKANLRVLEFGQSLSIYIYQVWRFLTFNSEELPFPFAAWPTNSMHQLSMKPPQD
jgi:hypothetical protein